VIGKEIYLSRDKLPENIEIEPLKIFLFCFFITIYSRFEEPLLDLPNNG